MTKDFYRKSNNLSTNYQEVKKNKKLKLKKNNVTRNMYITVTSYPLLCAKEIVLMNTVLSFNPTVRRVQFFTEIFSSLDSIFSFPLRQLLSQPHNNSFLEDTFKWILNSSHLLALEKLFSNKLYGICILTQLVHLLILGFLTVLCPIGMPHLLALWFYLILFILFWF